MEGVSVKEEGPGSPCRLAPERYEGADNIRLTRVSLTLPQSRQRKSYKDISHSPSISHIR